MDIRNAHPEVQERLKECMLRRYGKEQMRRLLRLKPRLIDMGLGRICLSINGDIGFHVEDEDGNDQTMIVTDLKDFLDGVEDADC